MTKDGILGTANAPIHMVTAETGQFKEQLWRTFRSIALTFLLISGIGALIEDRGISKGLNSERSEWLIPCLLNLFLCSSD